MSNGKEFINVLIDGVTYKLPKYGIVGGITVRLVTKNLDDTIFKTQLDTFNNPDKRPYYYRDEQGYRIFFKVFEGCVICEDKGSFNGKEIVQTSSKEWKKGNLKYAKKKQ